jgi:hypothetical protein
VTCISKGDDSACPFAFTDRSETVQNYGCLPTPREIVVMRAVYGKTWACHEDPTKPCAGAIAHLKREGLPYAVIDPALITERSDWAAYTKESL